MGNNSFAPVLGRATAIISLSSAANAFLSAMFSMSQAFGSPFTVSRRIFTSWGVVSWGITRLACTCTSRAWSWQLTLHLTVICLTSHLGRLLRSPRYIRFNLGAPPWSIRLSVRPFWLEQGHSHAGNTFLHSPVRTCQRILHPPRRSLTHRQFNFPIFPATLRCPPILLPYFLRCHVMISPIWFFMRDLPFLPFAPVIELTDQTWRPIGHRRNFIVLWGAAGSGTTNTFFKPALTDNGLMVGSFHWLLALMQQSRRHNVVVRLTVLTLASWILSI